MKRWVSLVLLGAVGCARLETTVRTERGPVLQTLRRDEVEPGGVKGQLSVSRWPMVTVTLAAYELCREQTIEVLNEDTITERSSNSTGPSLSMGIANVLASGVLFLTSLAVSNEPNRASIDVNGRYGPSTRQYVQGAGWVTMGIGVPALVVGLIGSLRSGETTTSKQVEQVASQRERPCNSHSLVGPVVINNEPSPRAVVDGVLELDASALSEPIEDLRFFGRTVALDDGSMTVLAQVNACIAARQAVFDPALADESALYARQELELRCSTVSRVASNDAVSTELTRRRQGESVYRSTPKVRSFDEAVRVFTPRLTFAAGSADVAQLIAPEALIGQAAVLKGVVSGGVTDGVGVVAIGEREVLVVVPANEGWSEAFVLGARIEGVVLINGSSMSGQRTLPLVRAVWVRPAF